MGNDDYKCSRADVFLTSFNAVSEDGILYNIDGIGNRIAGVIRARGWLLQIVGHEQKFARQKKMLMRAQEDMRRQLTQRFGGGRRAWQQVHVEDCRSPDSICSHIVETRMCRPAGRIKIILCK